MEGTVKVYFLDTHIVVWLFQKSLDLLSKRARTLIDRHEIYISPTVALELEYLYETGRITEKSTVVIDYLAYAIDLRMDDISLADIVRVAFGETWTRDPFDRLITAHARSRSAFLISKDVRIRKSYNKAVF
jgi:PIN domain nuclease of toxin-antitoxin system